MTEQPSLDDLAALKDWLRDSGAPAPHRPHTGVEMARARAEIEAERVDDLAEAERIVRALHYGSAVMSPEFEALVVYGDEYDRLRLVEQAATAFVQYESGGGTRDAVWVSRKMKLYDALAAAVHGETK